MNSKLRLILLLPYVVYLVRALAPGPCPPGWKCIKYSDCSQFEWYVRHGGRFDDLRCSSADRSWVCCDTDNTIQILTDPVEPNEVVDTLNPSASEEETDKDCGDDKICLKRQDCPSFLEEFNRYRSLTEGSEKSNILRKLRDAVCNQREKAVCCPNYESGTCDRDCATSQPRTCEFDFSLEMLKTDADGRRADGRIRTVLAYNGQMPGPPIVICEGDTLVVNFKNRISKAMTNADGSSSWTTLHFHGIREKSRPWSDGVPFVTQCPIITGDNFTYGFTADEADGAPPGTYWYHSHVGAQRTDGAYGALIIKENSPDKYLTGVIDDAANTLVLQEWYESSINHTPVSIIINGKGRLGEQKLKVMDGEDESEVTLNYLKGKGGHFQCSPNEDHNPDSYTTNYAEFDVEVNRKYRFRVIGAISQNFPLRLSIDDHKFTAIAMDSLNIDPVTDLDDLWLAAGERYDIVVQTKAHYNQSGPAYKIRVFGYAHQYDKSAGSLCTIAWMRYPGQTIDYSYVTSCDCSGFELTSPRTLNPVPNNIDEWNGSPTNGKYFIKDLTARKQKDFLEDFLDVNPVNPHYIEFDGNISFNGLKMTYPDVPFLLQNPANETGRCSKSSSAGSQCQNVLNEPWKQWLGWAEIVLINNLEKAAPHPIHKHGGWYWVVGEGMYNHPINRTWIMDHDTKDNPLPRNFTFPPAKDTIQVPPRGYVILWTPLDNAGFWIFHCHINYHVLHGMGMVLQIGTAKDWSTGRLTENEACKTPPPSPVPGGGPATIQWTLGMEPNTYRCVAPGKTVTFNFQSGAHNVDEISKEAYGTGKDRICNLQGKNHNGVNSPFNWTATTVGDHYFACGLGYNKKTDIGGHCKYGNMNALIHVSNHCK